jgi:hypothetical protein
MSKLTPEEKLDKTKEIRELQGQIRRLDLQSDREAILEIRDRIFISRHDILGTGDTARKVVARKQEFRKKSKKAREAVRLARMEK